jgi:hypothetical protein
MESDMLPDIKRKYGNTQVWLQMDGAPGHWARQVRVWTNLHFPERWIGRGGPVPWPPRSPDLTPPDFFLWEFIKNKVYGRNPTTLDELRDAIVASFHEVPVSKSVPLS